MCGINKIIISSVQRRSNNSNGSINTSTVKRNWENEREWNDCCRFLFHFFIFSYFSSSFLVQLLLVLFNSLGFFFSSSSDFPWCFCWCLYMDCEVSSALRRTCVANETLISRRTHSSFDELFFLSSVRLLLFMILYFLLCSREQVHRNEKWIFARINSIYCEWQFNKSTRDGKGNSVRTAYTWDFRWKCVAGTRALRFSFRLFSCFGHARLDRSQPLSVCAFFTVKTLCEINTIDGMKECEIYFSSTSTLYLSHTLRVSTACSRFIQIWRVCHQIVPYCRRQ